MAREGFCGPDSLQRGSSGSRHHHHYLGPAMRGKGLTTETKAWKIVIILKCIPKKVGWSQIARERRRHGAGRAVRGWG